MKIPQAYRGRCFYHFTHIENIDSIVKHGLLSTNEKIRKGIVHVNLANEDIQLRRSEMDVPCAPYGKIHDYVPFYFTARNPMLLSVLNRKNIDQPLVVYIAISIDKLLEDNVLFTDASANTQEPPKFYQDPKDLDELKWNFIDNQKWVEKTKEDLHSRMAEVFIYKKVPIDWIENYIVYNDHCKEKIEEIYKDNGIGSPDITYQPFKTKYFYFTKFFMTGRTNETLINGPILLEEKYRNAVQTIISNREETKTKKKTFNDINDALCKIERNFCVISELEGIFKLKTDNTVHRENVSDHTLLVVNNLKEINYFKKLSVKDKEIVKLAAYLHDIGKGPKSKWEDEIQSAYPDHPADSIPMIKRILTEEFTNISEYEIKKVCLLVFYHDLIGDILERGRSVEELMKLKIDKNELNMLISISLADVSAINSFWSSRLTAKLSDFEKRIHKEIC